MSNNTSDKKYCYRYYDIHDEKGRPIVAMWKRVIIRETEKTFWHVEDIPNMTLERLIKYRTLVPKQQQKYNVKRCLKGAECSKYHYTKEEALRAFVYRKTHQIEKIQLTEENARMCINGLREAGVITGELEINVEKMPDGEVFIAASYPEIPEGCVVVSLVPTTEMIAAAMNSIDVTFDDDDYIFVHHDTIYAAMLAAAPKLDGC